MSVSTVGSTSSTTRGEKLVAICQEITRLGNIYGEEGFPLKEKTSLRVFLSYNSNEIDSILDAFNIFTDDDEKLMHLKQLSLVYSHI
jgi:hypothetical protein